MCLGDRGNGGGGWKCGNFFNRKCDKCVGRGGGGKRLIKYQKVTITHISIKGFHNASTLFLQVTDNIDTLTSHPYTSQTTPPPSPLHFAPPH